MKRTAVAAGGSLALHAAVLLALGSPPPPPKTATPEAQQPVHVEVMRLAGVISPKHAAAPALAPPKPSRSSREQPRDAVHAEPVEARASRDRDQPVLREAQDERGGPGEAEAGSVAGPVEAAPLDTSALSQRLQQVALRCYPPAARRFRQTGEAQVRFCLDPAGTLRESKVTHSSGSELLDRAASDCVVPGAAPFGPEALGRCFEVPVRFRL